MTPESRCSKTSDSPYLAPMLSRKFDPTKKKTTKVLGSTMAYVEHGTGDPIVLLHGNPTSSYLWRHVIPELSGLGRCIAPDLIGMGDSARVAAGPGSYRFAIHAEYLEALLGVLEVESNVTLVGHDWGGPLLFDWGRKNANSVRGVAFMETLLTPLRWDDWPEASRRVFEGMRSEAGEEMVLTKNVFVERILPNSVIEPISPSDLAVYFRPYLEPGESRRPTLSWPREIPIDGHPADVHAIVEANEGWLQGHLPKLFIDAEPGFLVGERIAERVRTWPNLTEVNVAGSHFVTEDSGQAVGRAIASWLQTI